MSRTTTTSRASTKTGAAVFHANGTASDNLFNNQSPRLKIAIVGDFSGRESRGECYTDDIHSRPAYEITRDNFSEIFSQLGIRLQLPICDAPIEFMEFEDLHPDYLYSRVPLFEKFIELKQKLLNPEQFEPAAREIRGWLDTAQPICSAESPRRAQTSDFTLESILGRLAHHAAYAPAADQDVSRLIRSIVAPYVQQREDPRQADLLAAVSEATQQTMRSIMHHSAYQQLEASWRSVHWLIRRLDLDGGIDLHLLDISKEELLADLQQADDDLEQAQIFHRLVTSQIAEGSTPYQLVLGDFLVTGTDDDLGLLIDMGTLAEAAGSCFICGASSSLAGFPCLASAVVHNEPQPPEPGFTDTWTAIRDYSGSRHVIAASPRFMLRQPYGSKTGTTECFDYEELSGNEELSRDEPLNGNEQLNRSEPLNRNKQLNRKNKRAGEHNDHHNYLWGNSGYLVTLLLGQYFLDGGSDLNALVGSTVGDLPLHYYGAGRRSRNDPFATGIKPCAETLLTDSAAQQFRTRGLCTVRSVMNQDKVMIPRLNSLHLSGQLVKPWASLVAEVAEADDHESTRPRQPSTST